MSSPVTDQIIMAAEGEMSAYKEAQPSTKIFKYRKFVPFEGTNFTEDFKQSLLDSDSCFIPILLDENTQTIEPSTSVELRKVFLVHLQIRKMIDTVYTSEEYGQDGEKALSHNSDEMADTADEINVPRLSD